MERCVIQQKMRADGSPSNTKNPRFGAVARVRRAARENIQMLPMGSDIYRERSPRAREAMLRFWQYKKLKKKWQNSQIRPSVFTLFQRRT